MATQVTGIQSAYNSVVVEIPFREKDEYRVGEEVIFKDVEDNEEYGVIKYVNVPSQDNDKVLFASKILRKATANDIQKVDKSIVKAEKALKQCQDLVDELKIDMRVFRAGISFDGKKVFFMFTADDRVDFRELVKTLAKELQMQINLRQIGPRDKASLIGGYGKCGRELCCSSWLTSISSINMEMVRVQGLENKGSSKLSGTCGKLLCCLKYEVEAYKDLRKNLPRVGSGVKLKSGASSGNQGTVIAVDILNQKLRIALPEGESVVVGPDQISKILESKKR